ncbi:unnamed protein product [Cutaneotrichosporon oleaginosum]
MLSDIEPGHGARYPAGPFVGPSAGAAYPVSAPPPPPHSVPSARSSRLSLAAVCGTLRLAIQREASERLPTEVWEDVDGI